MSRAIATLAAGAVTFILLAVALPAQAAPRSPIHADREICADMQKLAGLGPIFKADPSKMKPADRADYERAKKMGDKGGSAAPDAMAQGILKMMTGDGGKGAPGSAETLRMLGC